MPLQIACRACDTEKHEMDITFLLCKNDKVYSAADDGKIKMWSLDLVKQAEVQAHPCSVYCLAASEDTLYSCSNDGTIKLWELGTLHEKETLVKEDVEFFKVAYSDGHLYAGDDEGNVSIFKDKDLYGQVNIAEPVKDMAIFGNLVFTVRDLNLIITELKLEGPKVQFDTHVDFMGRAPVTLIGDHLFAFTTRDGKEIQIHEIDVHGGFKETARMSQGTDYIINALAGVKWGEEEQLFSGGWDKVLKQWKIKRNHPTNEASIDVDIVIDAITCGEKNQVYVGGADGHIVRVDAVESF